MYFGKKKKNFNIILQFSQTALRILIQDDGNLKLPDLRPQVNDTDRATAICQRS
jgi:hypothetical protein